MKKKIEDKSPKEKLPLTKSQKGKLSRAQGARFELKVRNHLEENKWITDKWTKNVDLELKKLIPAKRKFNPFKKILSIGTGFPDFIAFKQQVDKTEGDFQSYKLIAIEAKQKGILDKVEKEKCQFLLDKNIFKHILIAKKGEKRGTIEYIDFATKKPFSIF